MSFASDLLGETSLTLGASKVEGKAGKSLVFSQTASGTLDGPQPSARVYVEYWGSADGGQGSAEFWLFLDTPPGRYEYRATAGLSALTVAEDGSAVYTFTGPYTLDTAPAVNEEGMPHEGTISLESVLLERRNLPLREPAWGSSRHRDNFSVQPAQPSHPRLVLSWLDDETTEVKAIWGHGSPDRIRGTRKEETGKGVSDHLTPSRPPHRVSADFPMVRVVLLGGQQPVGGWKTGQKGEGL